MKYNTLIIGAFFILIWLPLISMISGINPGSTTAHKRSSIKSIYEASSLSGKIVAFEEYFNENFGFRDEMVALYNGLHVKFLKISPKPKVVVGQSGWLYYKSEAVPDGTSINDFQGMVPFTTQNLEAISQNLSGINERLSEKGIQFIVLVAPSKESIYPEFLPEKIQKNQGVSKYDQLSTYLSTDAPYLVDPRKALKSGKSEHQLYFKTDSHWNSYGSYIAYSEIMNRLQLEDPSINRREIREYDVVSKPNKGEGDIAGMLSVAGQLNDTTISFAPLFNGHFESLEYDYPTHFYNLHRVSKTPNSKKILVFRDSFYTYIEPFVTSTFDESIALWTEQYDQEIVDQENPDIVIWEVAERYIDRLEGASK